MRRLLPIVVAGALACGAEGASRGAPRALRVLWSGDSIYRSEAIRQAVDAAEPDYELRNELGVYSGSTIGTALLEVADETRAYLGGSWEIRSRGAPFSDFDAFVFAFMRNDASLGEGVRAYADAYEKVIEAAARSFGRVVSGTAPPLATADLTRWEQNDPADDYDTAIKQVIEEWSACHADTHGLFEMLSAAGRYGVAELMADAVHPSDGAGATVIGAAVASGLRCGRAPRTGAAPPGRILNMLLGEPVVGTWEIRRERSTTSPANPLGRVAGLQDQHIEALGLGAKARFPPTPCSQVWVHYLIDAGGGATFTAWVDRGTPGERRRAYSTSTGKYRLHTMSRLLAADLGPGAHEVEVEITAGAHLPARLLGITCVGAP